MEVFRASSVDIRAVWPNEARMFTPWLAEHLDWLAEDLGIGSLSFEANEVSIPGGRSLDILATDQQGRAVAIENQYGVVNHDHLTRGLAYAVALQASDRPVSALIVIAEDHRDEFTAVADYLNECAAARGDNGISVFLVRVVLSTINDSPPSVRFEAVAQPNDWEVAARQGTRSSIPDLETFVEAFEPTLQPMASAITTAWQELDGCWLDFGVDSCVLYIRNPRVPQGRCNPASLYPDRGTLWINPGRLRESGAFDEEDMAELEQRILGSLPPTTTTGGKGYYLAFNLAVADPEAVIALLSWIAERLA